MWHGNILASTYVRCSNREGDGGVMVTALFVDCTPLPFQSRRIVWRYLGFSQTTDVFPQTYSRSLYRAST
jgi:hypothetical protein